MDSTILSTTRRFSSVSRLGHADALAAIGLGMTDFEDAWQASASAACGADVLVTRNTLDFKNAGINVLTPEEFLAS